MTNQGFSGEKQVHELEQALHELQNVKLGSEDEPETQKLKRLFLTFKTKYQQALKDLTHGELSQSSSQLAKKYQELQDENRALVQQQNALKEMLLRKNAQATPASSDSSEREQNSKLRQALQEKDRKIADLKHYELGFKRLSEDNRRLEGILNSQGDGERQQLLQEIGTLKEKVEQLSAENRQMIEQCEQQKHQTETLTGRERQLEKELAVQTAENQRLRDDLHQMKESMVRGLREARELKQYYQNLIDEKTSVLQKNAQIQRHMEELREEVKRREYALESFQTQVAAVKAEKQEVERILEKEKGERKEREENLHSLAAQIQSMRSQLSKAQEKMLERESEAFEAQHHLAKKVREASLLSEKVEEKQRLSERLQEEVAECKAKLADAHASLEKERNKTELVQQQVEGVEKKYFRANERLQKIEAELRELRKVEEKHMQMQQLLSNLGSVIGQPVGYAQPAPAVSAETPVVPVQSVESLQKKKIQEKPKAIPIQDDLFERPESSISYKKDLFE